MTTVLGWAGGDQAEAVVGQQVAEGRGDPVVVEADVEEPGAGDLGLAGDRGQVDGGGHLLRRGRGASCPVALASAMQPLAW